MIIAIDGPSGSGKSSISKVVAARLGLQVLDTGAMYRCITLKALNNHLAADDEAALGTMAQESEVAFIAKQGEVLPSTILLDGADVTQDIRTSEIDARVSAISAVPAVRAALVHLQQKVGAQGDYVVEGRDIGTVVFPQADLKIFLTASAEERARRRVKQNKERGVGSTNFDEVLQAIKDRDAADSSREMSPLTQALDAVLLDSSDLSIDEVAARIVDLATSRGFHEVQ